MFSYLTPNCQISEINICSVLIEGSTTLTFIIVYNVLSAKLNMTVVTALGFPQND
jgi:hypothetical protein